MTEKNLSCSVLRYRVCFLSFAERDANAYVPGITNIIEGGYQQKDGTIALSAAEKIERGKTAIGALAAYRAAKSAGNEEDAQVAYKVLQENIPYFGYGYIKDVNQLVPNVPLNFYAFRVMVILGGYFILFFIVVLFFIYKKGFKQNALDALGGFTDDSSGLHCRTSRLGGCRMWPSTVGYPGSASYIGGYLQVGCRFCSDYFLYLPVFIYRNADCGNRNHDKGYQEGAGGLIPGI